MADKKRVRGKKAPPRPKSGEYRFHVDAFTPETMPMHRLAEYLGYLSQILGERSYVHFDRLEGGSTSIVHRIEREAEPKVRTRIALVQDGGGPPEAVQAVRHVNRLLREDNASADLRVGKRGAKILEFPGRLQKVTTFPVIKQAGSLDGMLLRVGGKDDTVPVTLESDGAPTSGCYTTRAIAKSLASRLFEYVRLHGFGKWVRDVDGQWNLESFKITSFEALEASSLTDALRSIRELKIDWGKEPTEDLDVIGPGRTRGRHDSN